MSAQADGWLRPDLYSPVLGCQQRRTCALTSDVQARLAAHNAGLSKHTANGRPWKLVTAIEFSDAERARTFELYLKSGSGRAFARRYFR